MSRLARLALCALVFGFGCAPRERPAPARNEVVYGIDDRMDPYAYGDQAWALEVVGFSAALVKPSDIDASNPSDIQLEVGTLADEWEVCSDERFADQITAAYCSATLIAPDLVLTAGHCVDASDCANTRVVFDYYMVDATTLHTITSDDVYSCDEVLAHQLGGGFDHTIMRLDRDVVGRTPAVYDTLAAPVPLATPLTVHGHPTGLPLKLDDGGGVRDPRSAQLDYLIANLDTFGGNSGSGVFREDTHELVGILVRGEQDYEFDIGAGCNRPKVCAEDGCSGEDVSYAFRATDELCASMAHPLCPCGNGSCDAGDGETTVTCPEDCGTACNDGVCNGAEDPDTCPADCGTCGDGDCSSFETPADCPADCGTCGDGDCSSFETMASCCLDCGCSAGAVCVEDQCQPDPGPGYDCASAIAIELGNGTATRSGTTVGAFDDVSGSCTGDAPDRVYTFTRSEESFVELWVSGFDAALVLSSECGSAEGELACSAETTAAERPPGPYVNARVPAGSYFVVVDGNADDAAGAYQLKAHFGPPAPGDSCATAIDIEASGTQHESGTMANAVDDGEGSCGHPGADKFYRFSLSERANVDATLDGVGVMYLRSACEDSTSEIACAEAAATFTDLAPGEYYLAVDGSASYELSLTFSCADADGDGECDADEQPPGAGGGAPFAPPASDEGCACSAAGARPTGNAPLWLMVALLGARGVERRRRLASPVKAP
jgi:hypothetical protein